MTSIVLKSLLLFGIQNTPYPTNPTVIPSLTVEHVFPIGIYANQTTSARTLPINIDRWNPITARWAVEAGFTNGSLKIGAGHYSEHGIDAFSPYTESADYLIFEYRLTFP